MVKTQYKRARARGPRVGGGVNHRAIKNPKISKISNHYQTLDLSSSNSYLNGTPLGVLKFLLIWNYLGLISQLLDNYLSLSYFP